MAYDWEDDSDTTTRRSRVVVAVHSARRLLVTAVSYVLFAGALAAFWTVAQSWLGLGGPDLVWWRGLIGPVAAPTERTDTFVNATPLIVGCVTAAVAVKLR